MLWNIVGETLVLYSYCAWRVKRALVLDYAYVYVYTHIHTMHGYRALPIIPRIIRFSSNCRACSVQIEFLLIKTNIGRLCAQPSSISSLPFLANPWLFPFSFQYYTPYYRLAIFPCFANRSIFPNPSSSCFQSSRCTPMYFSEFFCHTYISFPP